MAWLRGIGSTRGSQGAAHRHHYLSPSCISVNPTVQGSRWVVGESWCSSKSSATSAHPSAGRGTIAKAEDQPEAATGAQGSAESGARFSPKQSHSRAPWPACPAVASFPPSDPEGAPARLPRSATSYDTNLGALKPRKPVSRGSAVLQPEPKTIWWLLLVPRFRAHPCAISWQSFGPETQSQPTRAERTFPTVWVLG